MEELKTYITTWTKVPQQTKQGRTITNIADNFQEFSSKQRNIFQTCKQRLKSYKVPQYLFYMWVSERGKLCLQPQLNSYKRLHELSQKDNVYRGGKNINIWVSRVVYQTFLQLNKYFKSCIGYVC